MTDFYDDYDNIEVSGAGYAREKQHLAAPLEDVSVVTKTRGLTLDDLEQLHAGDIEPEDLLSEDFLENEEVLDATDFQEPDVVPKKMKVQRIPSQSADIKPREPSREELVEQLQATFQWKEGERVYALDKLDDTRRVLKQTQHLFQRLPQYVERLSQVLHAQEQCVILYDRLAHLSENRGAAATIIQTARQIEVLEKNLFDKAFKGDDLLQMQQEIERHQALVSRYKDVFDLAIALEKQGFSASEPV